MSEKISDAHRFEWLYLAERLKRAEAEMKELLAAHDAHVANLRRVYCVTDGDQVDLRTGEIKRQLPVPPVDADARVTDLAAS